MGGIPDAEKLIDQLEKMGEEDVRIKLAQHIWGKAGPRHDLIQNWLNQKKEMRQRANDEAAVDREERSIAIANKAMKAARLAVIVSIVAIVVSILVAIFK